MCSRANNNLFPGPPNVSPQSQEEKQQNEDIIRAQG